MIVSVLCGYQCPQVISTTQGLGRSAVVHLASKKSEGSVCDGSMEANNSQNSICNTQLNVEWYVMRVTYQRELVARRLLEEMGIVCFVPTEKVKRR